MSNEVAKRNTEIKTLINHKETEKRILSLFANDKTKSDKFQATIINIALDENLSKCTPISILKSALMIAEVGLPLAKNLGQAYIVKYKYDAEAVIGYKGWLALAERSGKAVKSKPVYKCDSFEMIDNGFDETVTLKSNIDERKEYDPSWVNANLKGILISVKEHKTGVISNAWVSIGKILQIVGKSPTKNAKFSPYVDWAIEMYCAKAIKYVLSKTAMNEDTARAVEIDNYRDIRSFNESKDITPSQEKITNTASAYADLVDKQTGEVKQAMPDIDDINEDDEPAFT
ncbi:MAG: recombination protein RecT [Francisellaceae bacterium]|jgi:recombination protein RecT